MEEKINLEVLKKMQKQMNWESEFDYDYQASPRFWVIMDYKKIPANENCDNGEYQYYYIDGDVVDFTDLYSLKEFLLENEYHQNDKELNTILSDDIFDFDDIWNYLLSEYEEFKSCFMKEQEFIVENTMFLTKQSAKEHLELNKHHYTSKAHTYAMTAWRSKEVEETLKLLSLIDLDKITLKKEGIK